MNCTNCGLQNADDAKFCEGCGTKLVSETSVQFTDNVSQGEAPVTNSVPLSQTTGNSQQYIEKGKEISKLYFSYFVTVLKSPVSIAGKIRKGELTNGLITIALYVIMLPLMTYFGLKHMTKNSFYAPEISFGDFVMKPFILFFFMLALVAVIIFAALKIGKSSASLLDVFARLGAFLVVPTALFAIALILSLLGTIFFSLFLGLGLLGFSFVIPFIVYSFKQEEPNGLDTFYCTFITYFGIFILFMILGEQAFKGIETMMNGVNPFGF